MSPPGAPLASATVDVVVDTDPGVDDAVALLLAAACPGLRLLAITTVFGNADIETTTGNALRIRELAGLGAVPLARGAAGPSAPAGGATAWRPGVSRHGADGLGGKAHTLPAPGGGPSERDAVTLLADVLAANPGPVTVVAIGPLTNIARLLDTHPHLPSRIGRLVVMGGRLDGRGERAESNLRADPEAAQRVLADPPVPTTLVPLDLTRRAAVDQDWVAALARAGPRCATLAGVLRHYRALHDALAALEAAHPGTLRTEPMVLDVAGTAPERGALRARRAPVAGRRAVRVAVDADIPVVRATILDRLRSLR